MVKYSGFKSIWINLVLLAAVLLLLLATGIYLKNIYITHGPDKFIYSLVLILAVLIGVSYILLFILRKLFENDHSEQSKQKKRRLEIYRNTVNYITPFVLVAMLYHFWQKGWIVTAIVVFVLLLDRINEILRKNK